MLIFFSVDGLLGLLAQVSIFLSKDSISATIMYGAFIDLTPG